MLTGPHRLKGADHSTRDICGKLYENQPTGRAPLEVFSIVLLIISSRICPWKRRFEQRSEEERDTDQRRNSKTPNSRLMERVVSLLLSLSRDGWQRVTRIAHKEIGVLVPKRRSQCRRRRRTSRRHRPFPLAWRPPPPPAASTSEGGRRRRTGRWHPVDCADGGQSLL